MNGDPLNLVCVPYTGYNDLSKCMRKILLKYFCIHCFSLNDITNTSWALPPLKAESKWSLKFLQLFLSLSNCKLFPSVWLSLSLCLFILLIEIQFNNCLIKMSSDKVRDMSQKPRHTLRVCAVEFASARNLDNNSGSKKQISAPAYVVEEKWRGRTSTSKYF